MNLGPGSEALSLLLTIQGIPNQFFITVRQVENKSSNINVRVFKSHVARTFNSKPRLSRTCRGT